MAQSIVQTATVRPVRMPGKVASARDYNQLSQLFQREISLRNHDGRAPNCLFLDLAESGQSEWVSAALGDQTRNIARQDCRCFGEPVCADFERQDVIKSSFASSHCEAIAPPERSGETGDTRTVAAPRGEFDLVISCHSISFIAHPRAVCFLTRLRQSVRPGGMLFISALGKYSLLADAYPSEEHPLESRFFPLRSDAGTGLASGTRLCLYSERELCTTLFTAGWSVVRSSTTTENNVLATAIRL